MTTLDSLRATALDKAAGALRLLLAVLFLMTGTMKLVVPMLADAWSGQLLAANLPMYTLTLWTVPFVEIALGILLGVGYLTRLAVVVVMGMMAVATYVHIVVDDASLFPLQPSEPVIPLVVLVVSAYVLWRGGGAWSLDLKATQG